jgi:hypothetical protein
MWVSWRGTKYLIYKRKHGVYLFVCLFSVTNRAGQGQGKAGQGKHPPAVFSYRQGKAAVGARAGQGKADTCPLFSVIDRAG